MQGDQEGGLHGGDGDAGGDGMAPPIRWHLRTRRRWSGIFLSFRCRTRATWGVALALRQDYRLSLRLKCLEDAIPLLLDDIVLDSAPFRPTFRPGLYEDCRHDFSPLQLLSIEASIAQSQGLQQLRTAPCRRARRSGPGLAPPAGAPCGDAARRCATFRCAPSRRNGAAGRRRSGAQGRGRRRDGARAPRPRLSGRRPVVGGGSALRVLWTAANSSSLRQSAGMGRPERGLSRELGFGRRKVGRDLA